MTIKIASAIAPLIFSIVALPSSSGQATSNVDTRNAKLLLTVYLDEASIGDSGLTRVCMLAEGIASGMFAVAGVRIHWRTGQPRPYEPGRPILIAITSKTPETFHRGALAYAQVFEGAHIRIFYDRLKDASRPGATATLLAHVMVHEITHILEGIDGHSEHGIMKALWTPDDIMRMVYKPLPFDPDDVLLIRKGLANRSSSSVATAHPRSVRPRSNFGSPQ